MNLAITFLSHNDNFLFFNTLSEFLLHTNLNCNSQFNISKLNDIHFFILLQNCSKSFTNSIHSIFKCFKITNNINIINEPSNIGLSKANNKLATLTSSFKYVLHLEDDWVLYHPDNPNWLFHCIHFLNSSHTPLSTIALRKYGTPEEKYQYGWTRNIPYICHTYKDNFDYQNKLGETIEVFNNTDSVSTKFTFIKNYLFTFNPTIRKNKDYYSAGVYPLPEYNDNDTTDDLKIKGNHSSKEWGFCEALSMEKTRHLNTVMYEEGCFVHFDDWVPQLKNESKNFIFSNKFDPYFNINCHLPILIVILNKIENKNNIITRIPQIKHDFILPLIFYWDVTVLQIKDKIDQFKKVLSKYNPRVLITIGETINFDHTNYLHFIPFEYRKRWLHYKSIDEINLQIIEYCLFQSNLKHPQEINNPLISIITPAFESKHRIFRPFHSLLNQTYTNWEWIIIDDSISDETFSQLSTFADSDYRIQVYKRPKNCGSIGKNKLFCGNVARGNFIFELDHDDDILPHTFDMLLASAKKYPDAGFFYSDFIECYEDTLSTFNYGDHFALGYGSYYRSWWNNDFHYVCKTPRINPHTLRHIVGVPNHFRCWSREAYYITKGHSKDLSVVDDYELIIRTLLKFRWCHLSELCYIQYRNHGGDNFTFHRNELIQYLVQHISHTYNEDIYNRFITLGVTDDVYKSKQLGQPKTWEKSGGFEYPILDYVYKHNDTEDNPCISIIIPTYNRPDHLRVALDSVFNQTYQNFEIYVIGDKCPKLDEFVINYPRAKDHRFKYFNLLTNGGPGGHLPRNYALKMLISTKWVAYLDDDNSWLPNHLEHLVEEIKNDCELEFVYSSMIIDGKEIIFDIPKRGRIDTSCVVHRFDLLVKNNVLWKNRIEGFYWHDWTFFNEVTSQFNCKWKSTKKCTLLYSTEFNGQSYDQLIHL
jgi:glycosyltransferase involved in cell wall biosynthesis